MSQNTASTTTTNTATTTPPQQQKEKKQTMWEWYKEKPLQRWPFGFFVFVSVLSIIWIILFAAGTKSTAFILSGIVAIVMALFGIYHFKILLGLKAEIDNMSKLNKTFKSENINLQKDINQLSKARDELESVQNRLKLTNLKMKENIDKFKQLDNNLKNISIDNIEGLKKLRETSSIMMDKWKESLIKHEKALLGKVYDRFGGIDGNPDMNEYEFEQFLKALPEAYQKRFANLGKTFKDFAGSDGQLDVDELTSLLDTFAEAEATNGGSS